MALATLAIIAYTEHMNTDTAVGGRVREARTRAGLTQVDLANHMCDRGAYVTFTSVSKIESGTRALKFSEAIALCDALSITAEQLWSGDDIPARAPSKLEFLAGIEASIEALRKLATKHEER